MVSFTLNRIPTRSLSSRFSKLFSFSSFSRMPLFSWALLGNIWLKRQKLPFTVWRTWKGRGAPRWRVRTERTCTRWSPLGLNRGGLTIQSFKEIGLTQWEGEVVAHAQKLSKADHLLGKIPSVQKTWIPTLSSGLMLFFCICCRVNLTVSSLWEATITPTLCGKESHRPVWIWLASSTNKGK